MRHVARPLAGCLAAAWLLAPLVASADATYRTLPLYQDWSNGGQVQIADSWSDVPGIVGYLGAIPGDAPIGLDPRTLTTFDSAIEAVHANRDSPPLLNLAGVAEFDGIADRTVALRGSADADAPYLQIHVDTRGYRDIRVRLRLRDVDGWGRDAVQPVVLQHRVGSGGAWTNLDGSFVADASAPPGGALDTPIDVTLPADCDDAAQVRIRILTTNALGEDRWIGVDDIQVTGTPLETYQVGVNLGWDHCGTGASTAEKFFACDENSASARLVGSFRAGVAVEDFVGLHAVVGVRAAATTLPDWFALGGGGCRDGALNLSDVGPVAGCLNPWSGAYQGGGYVIDAGALPDRFRIRLDWARDTPVAIDGSALHTAFLLTMSTERSVDDGSGVCVGCDVAACFTLDVAEIYSLSRGRVAILDVPDVRQWAGWQGGGAICTGATPSRTATWGQVKALYR